MEARLTLAGMLQYKPDLFALMQIPTPPIGAEAAAAIGLEATQLRTAWTIERDDLAEYIALQTMGMSIAVPDYNFLKNAIGTWSKAHIHEWQRLFDTLFFKYNPLWNKDGTIKESGTDTTQGQFSNDGSSTPRVTTTTTGQTNAYDNAGWTDAEKTTVGQTGEDTTHAQGNNSGSVTYGHITTEQGNIGVVSSQKMVTEERELAMWSIEQYIADEFKKQFCLMVW